MLADSRYDDAATRLDKGRVRELAAEYATTRSESVREQLVLAHTGLVRYLALRFANRGEAVEDLIQVGLIGLLKAVDRFDPERGVEFNTYALPTIIGELKRHFRDKGWALHVPRRLQELNLAVGRLSETLTNELGRSPSVDELAARLDATSEEVLEAQEVSYAYSPRSLDAEQASEKEATPTSLLERIGQDDKALGLFEDTEGLTRACETLDPRERVVIYLRYFKDLSQVEIARRFNVSQMSISRLQQRAVTKLREAMLGEALPPA
jgi:RNA polymerase sigma-B factor